MYIRLTEENSVLQSGPTDKIQRAKIGMNIYIYVSN